MNQLLKFASVAAMALVFCAAGVGCASKDGHEDHHGSSAASGGGMMCPTCKTVWTFDTTGQGTRMQRLEAKPGMTCPTCDAMAASYMKDGQKVLHDCETCKVTPIALTPGVAPQHEKGTH